MSNDDKNINRNNIVKYYLHADVTKVVLVILCLLVLVIGISSLIKSGIEENITIVISFFGILATFIVVSNYSQISDIKNETNRRILQHDISINEREKQIKEHIDKLIKNSEAKIDNSLNSTNAEFEQIKRLVTTPTGESLTSLLSVQFNEFQQHNDSFIKEQFEKQKRQNEITQTLMYLIMGEHRELLLAVLQNQKYSCRVKHAGKSYASDAYVESDHIIFDIKDKIQTMDVSHVNGKVYSKEEMTKYIQTIQSLQNE